MARGYLNRFELTKERFIENPFASEEDKRLGKNLRLYRTGDLVRYLPDGNIQYIDRIAHRISLGSDLINLGESEGVLREEKNIAEVVVVAREDGTSQKCLMAYIVLEDSLIKEKADVKYVAGLPHDLKSKLPIDMIPYAFVILEQMPLTAAGKPDRIKLSRLNVQNPIVINEEINTIHPPRPYNYYS